MLDMYTSPQYQSCALHVVRAVTKAKHTQMLGLDGRDANSIRWYFRMCVLHVILEQVCHRKAAMRTLEL